MQLSSRGCRKVWQPSERKLEVSGIWLISENRKAFFDYEIVETLEAGLVLVGSEVKSLRDKNVTIKDSYVDFIRGEAFLRNLHIGEYKSSSQFNHAPERLRKLLLNRREIDKLLGEVTAGGMTCVPLKLYFSKGKAKVQIALVKGKKRGDKRESIKKRDVEKRLRSSMARSRR